MKFHIDQSDYVYTGFLKIVRAKVSFDSFDFGKTIEASREMMERGDSVGVLLYESDTNSFLLTRQFRFPAAVKDQQAGFEDAGWLDEIPAGKLEEGEEPSMCAERELLEELGYRCGQLQPISHFYVSPGGTSERIWLFYAEAKAEDKIADGGGLEQEHENIALVKCNPDRAIQMIQSGQIRDAKTILAIQWWMLRAENR